MDYRDIGALATKYVLREELSDDEERLILLLAVDQPRFLAERRALRAGLVYHIFGDLERRTKNEDIGLAQYIFERSLREYPSSPAGFPLHAFMCYGASEPVKLAKVFLKELSAETPRDGDAHKLLLLTPFMEQYFRDAAHFVKSKLAKLR